MRNQPIYISGKIGNLPENEVVQNFRKAELILRQGGFTHIVSPLEIEHEHDKSWESYMIRDIEALFRCHSVYMLENWRDSRGARIEHAIAIEMGKNIIYANHF